MAKHRHKPIRSKRSQTSPSQTRREVGAERRDGIPKMKLQAFDRSNHKACNLKYSRVSKIDSYPMAWLVLHGRPSTISALVVVGAGAKRSNSITQSTLRALGQIGPYAGMGGWPAPRTLSPRRQAIRKWKQEDAEWVTSAGMGEPEITPPNKVLSYNMCVDR